MGTTNTRRQPGYYDVMDRDDLYETRMPSSARRYKPTNDFTDDFARSQQQNRQHMTHDTATSIQRRSSAASSYTHMTGKYANGYNGRYTSSVTSTAIRPVRTVERHTEELPVQDRNRSKRFYTTVIVGMCVTIALLACLSSLVTWWQGFQEDMTYGNPRTAQLDAVVGHNDSVANPTHFIFINLHGQIQIIEIPGGNAAKTHVYTGPTLLGANKDRVPVTGEIVNQQGKQDLLVHVGGQDLLFVNNGSTFKLRQ
jgi:hypothetical protein